MMGVLTLRHQTNCGHTRVGFCRKGKVTLSKESTLEKDQTEVSAVPMITDICNFMSVIDSIVVQPPVVHRQ
jgi:hypothetical protein